MDRGDGIYQRTARLGLAEVATKAGRHDEAITIWKDVAAKADGDVPVDGVLIQLARTYQAAGKSPDAVQAYKRIVDEFPQSPYLDDARREMEALQGAPKS